MDFASHNIQLYKQVVNYINSSVEAELSQRDWFAGIMPLSEEEHQGSGLCHGSAIAV